MKQDNDEQYFENTAMVDELYQVYKSNPQLLPESWQQFFLGFDFAGGAQKSSQAPAFECFHPKELKVYEFLTAYRDYGHLESHTNPLRRPFGGGAPGPQVDPSEVAYLSLVHHGLDESDLGSTFEVGALLSKPRATLMEIWSHLRACYSSALTVQCADSAPDVREWLIREFEKNRWTFSLSKEEKIQIYESLSKTESLEKFIHTRYVGTKRFSIEGADSLIPMLESFVQRSTSLGVKEMVIGMAHRGRVNVLANFMGKGLQYIFADFNGPTETSVPLDDFEGDVKYHLGYHSTKETPNGPLKVTLAFNPSHLEAVNPVVLGITRAAQRTHEDTEWRKKVIPILIHGDAAFSGQGVVAETFQMAYVKGYTVGGTIHLVIDNQIGFTTEPINSRSSHYCTDISKIVGAPVLHVNGDDPESCVQAMDIALRFRQETGKDIVVNLVCYRRYGHNEGDEPSYTQPLMYEQIRNHPLVREIYGKKLLSEGIFKDESELQGPLQKRIDEIQKIYEHTKLHPPKIEPFKFEGFWKGLRKGQASDFETPWESPVSRNTLQEIGMHIARVPEGFSPHTKLLKLIESRKKMALGEEPIDWGMGELLAYGTLIQEGNSVRITGQDCVRGTFTHRHAAFYDRKTGEPYFALKNLNPEKEFCVYDSILSEYAVLGFEYGNSIMDPTFLTVWEAQFGDFVNGAQILLDQFISSGESKWQQMCGLVLLLPHGYEGQGPEHSSARLERFLQLCAQNNMQVTNLTTPAQIFHALRRQIKRPFRKPLINMSPKSLLRHPRAVSNLNDFTNGSFQEVIPDFQADSRKVETLILCTGKIYYELEEEREKQKNQRTALVRIEQLYPTPIGKILQVIRSYPSLRHVLWVQEEPKNMGAYPFLFFRLSELFIKENLRLGLHYIGRTERASPATGSIYRHRMEQSEIIKNAFLI